MNNIVATIKGVYYRIIGRKWITAKGARRVPMYTVEDSRVFVLARSARVVKK